MKIRARNIGPGSPVYVIAEMSANHGQSFERACEIVRAAKAAGADAVKLQTYTPDTMTLKTARDPFRIAGGTPWDGKTLHELYAEAQTPWEWQPKLKALAESLGLHCFSSPFDSTAVDFLQSIDVPAYKIASFELVDLALIEKVASTGRPMLLSTGMASLEEIRDAVEAARAAGGREIALLKCTSAYPAPAEDMNLLTIPHLRETFKLPVGLSDHTIDSTATIAAVALGACIIEKHFTLSRNDPGQDSAFSLEPAEFKQLVFAIRTLEKSLGRVQYGVAPAEEKSRIFRRSLFIVKDIEAGGTFTTANVQAIRSHHP